MDFFGLGFLTALALLFGFLAYRALRARRLWIKLLGGIPAALLTLIWAAALVLSLAGYSTLNATRPNPPSQLTVQLTPQLAAQGERLARTCAGCHSANGRLPLSGQDFFAEGGPPIGTFWAPNLTPAHLAAWSDGEIIRAIREGVGRDGRTLLVMPSRAFRNLSDEDVQALVAYLRAQAPIEPASPPRRINVLGALMIATLFPAEVLSAQPPLAAPVTAPPRGPTAAYGGYLANLGCRDCHGANLAGAPVGSDSPPGPNLTTVAGRLSATQFVTLLRTGTYPDGRTLREDMPWQDLEQFSDDDFRALYLYFQSQPQLPDNR